jgi:thioredoxin 1
MLLDQDRFEEDVRGSAEATLVDFFGTWCPPCKELAPTIDRLARDGYRVCKVNIEDRPELTKEFRVSAVPTVVALKGGKEVARFVGVQTERTLKNALDQARAAA